MFVSVHIATVVMKHFYTLVCLHVTQESTIIQHIANCVFTV